MSNIKEYFMWILPKIGFSNETLLEILCKYERIEKEKEILEIISNWVKLLLNNEYEPAYSIIKKEPFKYGILGLISVIIASYKTFLQYIEKGISQEVFIDTMSDIKIWADIFYEEYGFWGICEINWLSFHLTLKVFKLGRLQFQFSKYHEYNELEKVGDVCGKVKEGDNVLEVHIPQGEKLILDDCIKSFSLSREFVDKFFVGNEYVCYICNSWLLSPKLKYVLNSDSNIIKFQKMFNIIYFDKDSEQFKERIFGRKNKNDLSSFIATTSLQKNILEYMKKDNKIGEGFGVLFY